ncbi:MAG TPA: hypothetical protein VER26_11190 [Xanthobacteraceae bacterium]|nr:hypothetical protein [Xanthobacteraceae bacterium]
MRSIVLLCALAILSGCADSTFETWKTKAAANRDAEDDAKCQSSGGKPDDPAYVQCRAQLDAARTQSGGGGRRIRAKVFRAINTSAVSFASRLI